LLEFILGRSGTGKTSRCLNDIKNILEKSPEGPPLFLILPEHMTFKMERRLAMLLNDNGGFSRAFVFGFRRLCQYILTKSGGANIPRINEIGKNLLLSRIILENKQNLSALAKAAQQRNFTASLSAIIEELKTYGISSADLQEAALTTNDESLQQKLTDLALLYDAFNQTTADRYNDNEDILALTTQKILAADWLQNCEIWIDGFVFFNPQELALLQQLFSKADNIHITLCIDDLKANSSEAALFHRQYRSFEDITDLCNKLNIPTNQVYLKQAMRFLSPAQKTIEEKMFVLPLQEPAADAAGIKIAEAANRRLEAEAAVIDIVRLCREENYQYNDIGIIIREPAYNGILQAILQDYKIPFFSDNKRLFVHHPLAELLRSCLEAIRTWQYEPLLRCFKTDFFDVTRDDIDILENYVLEFGIKGKKIWLSESDWTFCQQSFNEALSVQDEEYLEKINNIRRQLLPPLAELTDNLANAQNIQDYTYSLYNFLMALNVPEKLALWQKTAEDNGELAIAKEHEQIWQDTIDLLDQLVDTCGNEELSLKEYLHLLNDGLDALQISLIPPGLDYITIASFEQNSLENKDAVYILGTNEGIMPKRSKPEGLLSDSDRLYLSDKGLSLSITVNDDNFFENFLLYKAFTLSRKYTWISYALADTEGSALNKSILIDRLHSILPLSKAQKVSILLENYSDDSEKRRVVTPHRSISYLTAALRQYREKSTLASFWFDVYNWLLEHQEYHHFLKTALAGLFAQAPKAFLPPEIATAIYSSQGTLKGSVTRFEQFHSCPFKHFARYALKLTERAEFNFAAPDRGMLLHETMRRFGETLLEKNLHWSEISAEERHDLCQQIVKDLSPQLQNQILLSNRQYEHLTQRIAQTAEQAIDRLCNFSRHSEFSPIAMEKTFGSGTNALPPLIYDLDNNHKISISGQIDRIDSEQSGRYFLIIDYKSGNAYINLSEVYYGLKLQLLTYMLVVQNAAEYLQLAASAIPAGILYCFLKTTMLTFNKEMNQSEIQQQIIKQMRMPGWILLDTDVIKKIDDSATFIKVNFNKNGSLSKASLPHVKTEEEFYALLKYMDKMLINTGNRILTGDSAITPYKMKQKTACMFCPYIALCRFDISVPGYKYNELADQKDEVIIERIKTES